MYQKVSEPQHNSLQGSVNICSSYDANFPFPSLRPPLFTTARDSRLTDVGDSAEENEEEEGKVFQNRTHTLVSGVWLIKEVYTLSE